MDNLVVCCEGEDVVVGLTAAGPDEEDPVPVPVVVESFIQM